MASEHTLELTDSNFEQEVVRADVPALVDFWAEWCMPCKMLAPTIDELAAEYRGTLKVGKVDTDSNREISMKFGISAIPTLILFKDGAMIKKFVGLQQKAELKAAIDEAIGS
ncbi:MAG: thioredoxin [Phycisphaerae bacterium]|nr:thioredoxin [Phycisphaerae bacterium]